MDIDPAVQITQNLSVSNGGLVTKVLPDTPAATAGIMAGDIITGINDLTLNQNQSLDNLIGKFQAGSQITLKILRSGQNIDVPVVLGQLQ
jgi:serine protease Do